VKVSVRNVPPARDPAVILISQLKKVYIDGELDAVETGNWFSKLARKHFEIAFLFTPGSVDDPDQQLYENYACGSDRNYTGYCNPETEKLFDEQSMEADQEIRSSERDWYWYGRSIGNYKRTGRGRSSTTIPARPAGDLT